jgi:serine/threonine protein phosphatase 1
MRRFAIGDLHGNFKGYKQALERAGFDYDEDLLICVGDIADGFNEVPQIIDDMMRIRSLIWILGNHDKWVQDWMSGKMNMNGVGLDGHPVVVPWGSHMGHDAYEWLSQGGRATYCAYMEDPRMITKHRGFWLEKPVLYHVVDNKCFVHGGFDRNQRIAEQAIKMEYRLYWDRELWKKALCVHGSGLKLWTQDDFDEIFVGHTATTLWGTTEPMNSGGIWNIDTGGGWSGKVTIINIDTKEYFQSDTCQVLYPDVVARR